jgi:hypothetical protein
MGSLFSQSSSSSAPKSSPSQNKKNEITQKDRAILDLKIARDKLTKYQKKVL